MDIQILIGGKAGQGVAKAAEVLGRAFVRKGYYVFNYREYPSLIKGGHNFNVLHVSDSPTYSHEFDGFDVVVAFDRETVDIHGRNGSAIIALDTVYPGADVALPSQKLKEIGAKYTNTYLLAATWRYLGGDRETLIRTVEETLPGDVNRNLADLGYNSSRPSKNMERGPLNGAFFMTGNEAIGAGAIAAGIDLYIAYPMTPATPVLHYLAARQRAFDYAVLQLENEIAVVNAALGASYAGAMTMVGTSGGGFALMTEALSLQGMSEIPLVVYLAQRSAPSTGIPTYTGQGDLKFAVNAGHGEFPRVVVAPGDPKEAFERTVEAFYLAYKYRVLAILMGDKHLGESHYTVERPVPRVRPERFIVENPGQDYRNYRITENGVSPRAVPGTTDYAVRATSYEHDEDGHTTEDGEWAIKMNDKRWRKMRYLSEEVFECLEPISVYGEGKNVIVSWGSTKGAILDALRKLQGWKFVQISYIVPFPAEQFREAVEDADRIVLVENNVTGLLGQIIAEQTGMVIDEKILRYDARPFTPSYILRRLEA